MKAFDLSGKVAVITGASRGLGLAMAKGLAEAGADLVLADVLDTAEAVKEIEVLGRKAIGIKVDVTSREDIEAMVKKAVDEFGHIDILINNAGVLQMAPADQMDEKAWDKVLNVNLKGSFRVAQAVGKQMIEQGNGGSIINLSSVAGLYGFGNSANYCASKGGVLTVMKTLALEWAQHGIRVNAICPGLFHTDMTKDLEANEAFKQMIQTRVPLKRGGDPEELAGTAVYLASDASSYTTGHAMVVDGGWTAGL